MKYPFDLNEALRGAPIVTGTGDHARIMTVLENGDADAPLVVAVKRRPYRNIKSWNSLSIDPFSIESYYKNGRLNKFHESESDLFIERL